MMSYYVYILESHKDGASHIGSTRNLTERLQRRNQGRSPYTKSKRPWTRVYSEEHSVKSTAISRENQIKTRKSKQRIESLIRTTVPLQNDN